MAAYSTVTCSARHPNGLTLRLSGRTANNSAVASPTGENASQPHTEAPRLCQDRCPRRRSGRVVGVA